MDGGYRWWFWVDMSQHIVGACLKNILIQLPTSCKLKCFRVAFFQVYGQLLCIIVWLYGYRYPCHYSWSYIQR